jgi:uncharacterized protein (DUF1786 family)
MNILCLDIGSGTQDILLLDTTQTIENSVQLILPAPTVLLARKIKEITARGENLVLSGETMGGGACTRAMIKHLEAGLQAYATPESARTFSDNLELVTSWGLQLISPDEAAEIKNSTRLTTSDVMLEELRDALIAWNIAFTPDIIAIAVLDHGTTSPGESERLFRFRQLEKVLSKNNKLESFIYLPDEVPEFNTRMQAIIREIGSYAPLLLLDTGAAAVIGASLDRVVSRHSHRLSINMGNSHTLAFLLNDSNVLGLFEHHTSELTLDRLETLLDKLVAGELQLEEVWKDGGHGSFCTEKGNSPFTVVTGPRRVIMEQSRFRPYFAAPFGSMMLTGCFGLARATALKFPDARDEINRILQQSNE